MGEQQVLTPMFWHRPLILLLLFLASAWPASAQVNSVKKVFLIVLENHNWSTILPIMY